MTPFDARRQVITYANLRRAAVDDARAAAGVRDETEFGGQHHLMPAIFDGPANEFLVGVRSVDLGGRRNRSESQAGRNGKSGIKPLR